MVVPPHEFQKKKRRKGQEKCDAFCMFFFFRSRGKVTWVGLSWMVLGTVRTSGFIEEGVIYLYRMVFKLFKNIQS